MMPEWSSHILHAYECSRSRIIELFVLMPTACAGDDTRLVYSHWSFCKTATATLRKASVIKQTRTHSLSHSVIYQPRHDGNNQPRHEAPRSSFSTGKLLSKEVNERRCKGNNGGRDAISHLIREPQLILSFLSSFSSYPMKEGRIAKQCG